MNSTFSSILSDKNHRSPTAVLFYDILLLLYHMAWEILDKKVKSNWNAICSVKHTKQIFVNICTLARVYLVTVYFSDFLFFSFVCFTFYLFILLFSFFFSFFFYTSKSRLLYRDRGLDRADKPRARTNVSYKYLRIVRCNASMFKSNMIDGKVDFVSRPDILQIVREMKSMSNDDDAILFEKFNRIKSIW